MPVLIAPNMTAQDNASIQLRGGSAQNYFAERRGGQWFPDAYIVRLSDNLPENAICIPIFSAPFPGDGRNEYSVNEGLDWDFVADKEPLRNVRTIKVKLKYLGHDPVIRFEDYLS